MKILFTGFAPESETANPMSWKWIEHASQHVSHDHFAQALQVPFSWDDCFETLRPTLNQGWDAVVCLGSRPIESLAIERLALNETDAACKDCLGRRPRSKVIDPDGEAGYWTGLPYRELGLTLSADRLPSKPSHSAGGGLSNFLFYKLMNWIALSRRSLVGGLIHVPEQETAVPVSEEAQKTFVRSVFTALTRSAERSDSLMVDLDRMRSLRGSPAP
ncbi:hypothetical protein [Pelagicoccus sp. SDUM812003]|uniref:pyroglutamyl-peptidase I family protein n=1 Tax=Pelagicoccus sp. SDUM812003 TaxID=3041267 RepID=UPI00280D768D|nr:hypothetical protein [Pelagicoccus sp. SDUM812003]MDQ8203430.1 hypothetical protein [Pelagicoccus sp. SDUM812003]